MDVFEEEQRVDWVEEWIHHLAEENGVRIAGRPAGWFVGPSTVPPPGKTLVFKGAVLTVHPYAKNTIVTKTAQLFLPPS